VDPGDEVVLPWSAIAVGRRSNAFGPVHLQHGAAVGYVIRLTGVRLDKFLAGSILVRVCSR
jgi:hypothetical protein